jgi:zinc and cadmium transporter
MPVLLWILGFALLASLAVVLGASGFLLASDTVRRSLIPHLVSYAVGTLLGAAFLGLLPRALESASGGVVMGTTLVGFLLFFILEKWVLWRHCHERECAVHSSAGMLILIGDAFHNFFDGFAIAAAFLTSFPLGISTALAVIAHEVPQEVGDFAILLDSGYSPRRALACNLLSSAATLPGALVAFFALSAVEQLVPYVLALSAASFLYIAAADLIPGLHRFTAARASVWQLLLLGAGIATIVGVRLLTHS